MDWYWYIRTAKETQLGKMAAAEGRKDWGLGRQSSDCVGKEDYFVAALPEMVSSTVQLSKQIQRRPSLGGLPMLGRCSQQTPKAV